MSEPDFEAVLASIDIQEVRLAMADLDEGTIPHTFDEPEECDWVVVYRTRHYAVRPLIAFAARHCCIPTPLGHFVGGKLRRTIDFNSARDGKCRDRLETIGFVPQRVKDGSTDG
jgi:hypothetical protein